MNKIKQTEQNLQSIRNQLRKEDSRIVNALPTEELLKQTQLILKPKQQRNPIFVAAKMQIKQELEERQKYYDDRRQQLKGLLEQNNTQYINFNLLNSLIPNINFDYLQSSCRVILSTNNKINFQRRQSRKASQLQVTKINGQFLDEYQQQIYKIFNTREQIHFIFKNEMDLNIRVIPCRIKQVFREDKNTYEVILMENQLEEEQNELPNVEQRELSVQNFRFQFLNRIQYWNLVQNTNVPSVLVRQYNLYLILREVILDALDYMHLKTIDILQDEILENELPSFKTHTSTEQSTDNRMKQIEKKVKTQALKLRRQKRPRKSSSIDHLLYLQSDQLKDYRVSPIPHNQGYQAQRAVKDYLKETTQTNLPACSKLGKGGIDKVQKGEYFLKQKGKKDEYHICWLEQRGFHLVWYHLKTDKTARGIGQLDDTMIRDEGKMYQVKLLDRFLTIKLDKPLVGQIWRKSISNQIAYKTYLNNLWFNCRLFDNSPKVSLVDYFFNENTNTLDLSDNALNLKGLSNVLPLCYITKVTQIFFDSLMNHKIYQLNLQNSHLGPVAIVQLLQYFQHNKHRIKMIDMSNCALTIQTIKELTKFLLNQNSFSLNQIYLNDNPAIGDEGITLLSEAIQQRYERFWDTSIQEIPSSPGYRRHPRQKTSARENTMDLELLIVLNFKNVGARDFSKLFDAIGVMIKHSLDLPSVDKDLMREQTLSRVIKKLKNKQYNRRNLQLIKEFYADEIDPILEIIKMQLDISDNQMNSLHQLGELLSQFDCFRSLHLRNVGLGIQDLMEFSKRVVNSISLELLEMTCSSQGDIQCILDSLSENTSLKTIVLECTGGELQSGFSFQYFIADKITLAVGSTIVLLGGVIFFWRRQPALQSELILENSEEFQEAARKAKKLSGLSHPDQLLLYGLYKQATLGDCNIKEPMRLHLQDHAKWVAWMACKGIEKEQAEQQYIRHVQKYLDSGVTMSDSQQSQQMGMRVSTMKQGEHETNEAYMEKMNTNNQLIEQVNLSEDDKVIFDQIVANIEDPNELQRLLGSGNELQLLQYETEQKIKLIHSVVDSENVEALLILLPRYVHYNLVNIQESVSGMTALHYACLSGNREIVELLLQNGADPRIQDFSGQDCFQTIDKENREWLV